MLLAANFLDVPPLLAAACTRLADLAKEAVARRPADPLMELFGGLGGDAAPADQVELSDLRKLIHGAARLRAPATLTRVRRQY